VSNDRDNSLGDVIAHSFKAHFVNGTGVDWNSECLSNKGRPSDKKGVRRGEHGQESWGSEDGSTKTRLSRREEKIKDSYRSTDRRTSKEFLAWWSVVFTRRPSKGGERLSQNSRKGIVGGGEREQAEFLPGRNDPYKGGRRRQRESDGSRERRTRTKTAGKEEKNSSREIRRQARKFASGPRMLANSSSGPGTHA